MRESVLLFVLIVLSSSIIGMTNTISSFDDGCSDCLINTNTTKQLTLMKGVTIIDGNITIISTSPYCYQESANISSSCGGLSTGKYYYVTTTPNYFNNINDWNDGSSDTYIEPNTPLAWGIHFFINYSKPVNAKSTSLWQIKSNLNNSNYSIIPDCWSASSTKIMYHIAFTRSANIEYINAYCYNNESEAGKALGASATSENLTSSNINPYPAIPYTKFYEESMWWDLNLSDPKIQINNSILFNRTANYSGINIINLNKTELQSYINNNATLPFDFLAYTWGQVEVLNVSIRYNRTYSALLNIYNPDQISTTQSSGDFTTYVSINNSGDYSASNCSFKTVSSGTPNYNTKLSYTSFFLENNTNKTVQLTISNINQNSESDEKLQLFCNGTDDSQNVYSDYIDLDITYNAGGGGGGGGGALLGEMGISVVIPSNQLINAIGKEGLQKRITFLLRNNKSFEQSVNFVVDGVDCIIEYNNLIIQGNSVAQNSILCTFPADTDTGIIEITSGAYSTRINVVLQSNLIGEIVTYLNGGEGTEAQIAAWMCVVVIISILTFILTRIK